MSQSDAGPSAPSEAKTQQVKAKQTNKALQQNKAVDNRSKAQQNKERAALNRARKANNVTFAENGSATQDGQSTSESNAKQTKKQTQKSTPKPQAARQGKPPTQFKSKVVIRRLPPNLPEDVFWKAVSPWIRDKADCQALTDAAAANPQTISEPPQGEASTSNSASNAPASTAATPTVDYKHFVAGKLKTDANKQNKHARAYVRFLDAHSLVQFYKAFDGHVFRDSKGKESVAIVEFAPYQKVVLPASSTGQRGRRAKPDPKQGTIEKDADYLSFVERLNKAGDDVKRSEGDLLASLHDPRGKEKEKEAKESAGKSTPLLQHLRAVKMARLESAAAIKKAKRLEKAAAKAAAAGQSGGIFAKGGVVSSAASTSVTVAGAKDKSKAKKSKKKDKLKGKAKSVSAVGDGVKPQDGITEKSVKKNKGKKPKGKAVETVNSAATSNVHGTLSQGSENKKSEGKPSASTDGAQGEGASKGKPKNKPPRRKGGPKDRASTRPDAARVAQPPNMQILKRES